MIQVEQLVFEYPGHKALDGVSLHIEAGSVTALVGPNGAGKSTLMRCIAGLEQALSGRITVHGIDVMQAPRQVHQHLGYLSDFYGLYESLTVQRCLAYAGLARGLDAQQVDARVQTVAQQLDLLALLQRKPGQLSRGQRQRLAIGQAIMHQPKVLLLDEPASGLDPEARSSLSGLFRQLNAQGMTLVVSSHILSELDEYSTHLLSLRHGQVEHHGPLHTQHAQQADWQLYALELAGEQAPQHWQAALGDVQVQDWGSGAGQPLLLWLPQAAPARAALVAQWVAAGLPLASLQAQRETVQAKYLKKEEG